MKKCVSVKLKSLISISDKCFKAVDFNGNEALIPKSQVFGIDEDISKSEAYWISTWIMEQKNLTYSNKKQGWYNPKTGIVKVSATITHHIPEIIEPVKSNRIEDLKK